MNKSINLDPRIKHLTEKEIEELMERYYDNENVKELISYYRIDVNPSRLYTLFPEIILYDKKCPNCSNFLVQKRRSKSSYSSKEDIHCSECEHDLNKKCFCEYCIEKRKNKEEERLKEIKFKNEMKKKIMHEIFNLENRSSVIIEDLEFKDKVYIGALLRTTLSEDMKKIKSIEKSEFKLSPNNDYSFRIIKYLINKNIIVACPESNLNYFILNDDGSIKYSTNKVDYNLNINIDGTYKESIFTLINAENFKYRDSEALELWKEIALEEVLEILNYEMVRTKFNFNPGEKTILVFKDLLENFSVGQVYGIIWRQVANASKWYQQGGANKKHAANSVITNCQSFGERALNEGWDLTNYYRPKECKQSMLSKFYFDRVLGIGDLGFNIVSSSL